MKHLRITTLDDDGTLHVFQLPLSRITAYGYRRSADESDHPSRLELALEPGTDWFPSLFSGSEADDVAKALRLHRPPMREGLAFAAMIADDAELR